MSIKSNQNREIKKAQNARFQAISCMELTTGIEPVTSTLPMRIISFCKIL